jgi:virulence factor Mce-like protein
MSRRRRATASLVASPVLVGAVTVLVSIIAVFIAYNANSGLPFVPTYDLKAQLPSGAKLVAGNEVRVGGFRVGVIKEINPTVVKARNGAKRAVAEVLLKLDKTVQPLAVDSKLRTRPRSALGLKYVELTPGHSKRNFTTGDTIPLKNASEPLDLEDVFATFDRKTRPAARQATEGFGDAFAGRGVALNQAIQALNPFFRHLTPVMRRLSDPDTELDQFFRQLGATSAQVAPVARTQAQLFSDMADTFAAIAADPRALQQTIEKSPPTLDVAIRSFRVQRPFLADFADLSRRLRPAARELPRSLPPINSALRVGTPILPDTVELNRRLERALTALRDLFRDPNTLLALRDLRTALSVGRPAIEFIAPYQTVCNDTVYFLHPLGEVQSAVQTGPTGGGTVLQNGLKVPNAKQPNNYGTAQSSRAWDVGPGINPIGAKDEFGDPLMHLDVAPYSPAIDAQGNADCQIGQFGYLHGPLTTDGRYGPGVLSDGTPSAGNFVVTDDDMPILSGGTYKSRQLGINNLRDVP